MSYVSPWYDDGGGDGDDGDGDVDDGGGDVDDGDGDVDMVVVMMHSHKPRLMSATTSALAWMSESAT